ncbi:MAG: hypothetical protein IPK66_02370 [Rhodospirillales bacterium]|nr:hypothetical protein [Rhodospirillales bacterium]
MLINASRDSASHRTAAPQRITSADGVDLAQSPVHPVRFTRGDDEDELRIGQLLCARLCHDLIGPASAINAGEELIGEGDGTDDGEARELIIDSARQLTGRLKFFRMIFGQGSRNDVVLSTAELRALSDGFLYGGRAQVEWADGFNGAGDIALTNDGLRMLLCLVLLAADALPRGGGVRVEALHKGREISISLVVSGASARLSSDVVDALQAADAAGITARTVHAYYLSRLAERLDASLVFLARTPHELRIDVRIPKEASKQRSSARRLGEHEVSRIHGACVNI